LIGPIRWLFKLGELIEKEVGLKIAIAAEGPDLKARVGNRLGTSRYVIVVDLSTTTVEAVPNPSVSGQGGSGMQVVAVAISKKVNTVLTGYCNPTAQSYLKANGIEVLTGIGGTVTEAVEQFKRGHLQNYVKPLGESGSLRTGLTLSHALRNSCKQFVNLMPIMVGVMLLVGLFNAFVSKESVSFVFSGNKIQDTLLGACVGSILAGNPINSYIIGGELLEYGIGLAAVTALIVSWVTVGLIQLPAEIAALGRKFALVRNATSFVLSLVIAFFIAILLEMLKR
jgi:predicted Fe-Mo cluster-binding NifX family protein